MVPRSAPGAAWFYRGGLKGPVRNATPSIPDPPSCPPRLAGGLFILVWLHGRLPQRFMQPNCCLGMSLALHALRRPNHCFTIAGHLTSAKSWRSSKPSYQTLTRSTGHGKNRSPRRPDKSASSADALCFRSRWGYWDVRRMIRKCERCGHPMDLFACKPHLGTLPELRSYRCPACRHVETDAGTVGPLQRGDIQGARAERLA